MAVLSPAIRDDIVAIHAPQVDYNTNRVHVSYSTGSFRGYRRVMEIHVGVYGHIVLRCCFAYKVRLGTGSWWRGGC